MYTPNAAQTIERSPHSLTRVLRLRGLSGAIVTLAIAVGLAAAGGTVTRLTTARAAEKKTSGLQRQLVNSADKGEHSVKSFSRVSPAVAPAISFCDVPTSLPRGTSLVSYSPVVCLQYSGLGQQVYTLKAWLLGGPDQVHPNCGSTQWCERPFTIDNTNGQNSSGTILVVENMDVYNIELFYWLLRLYDLSNNEVAPSVQQPVSWTTNRAPALNPIGNKTVTLGQSLDFTVSASDAENDAVSFTALNLPSGATLNSNTGQFHWQPATLGTYSSVGFIATQTGATPLSDAELITIQVQSAQPAGVLALSAASFTTGEAGPATLTITRTNGSTGSVGVSYSTVNGTAGSGSDFIAASSATVTFADGETSKIIRVPTVNDAVVETNETFQVVLSAPTGGATLGGPSQATVTIVDDDTPQLAGQWGGVISFPTVPIHLHLLPTGKVMFWDRHDDTVMPMLDVRPRLWDPDNPTEFTIVSLPDVGDIFCSGHTLMADGRLLVAGGHITDNQGTSTAEIYNPFTGAWTSLPNMNEGRWYPSTTTLPNGDVLVLAGTRVRYRDINPLPQVLQIDTNTWRNLSSATLGANPAWADYYPFTFVAPNGKVFVAGPQRTARYLDTTGAGAWTDVANSSLCYRDYGSSAMYNDGKVLIVGGNPRNDCDVTIPLPILPSATAEVIDLSAPTPAWRTIAPMSVGRRHLNTTILPDGKVLVTGGSSAPGHDDPAGAVFFAELWDPNTEQWTILAGHVRYRGYHSNAMLLPDARVLVAGGGHPDPSGGTAENNAEIYSPPYLFKGARPVITTAPTLVTYGQTFSVQTPDAANIANVNWIRLSSVTHAFNESQRINHLIFSKTSNNLSVTAPANANLCPPGYYMLFILDSNGIPSVAKIVQVLDSASIPCSSAQMTSPTNGSTIAPTTTFTWNTGTGNAEYWLQVGTTGVGSNNLYSSSQLTGTSRTLSGLPSGTIYVRLSSRCGSNNTWSAVDYSYTGPSVNCTGAQMTSPTNGSTIAATTTFTWNTGTGNTEYWLQVGTTGVGSNNLYSSSQLTGTSRTLSGLPSGTIYVRLSSRCGANNAWSAVDYSYTGPSANCTGAQMTSPANGSTIASVTVFNWNAGTGNTEYWLQVGTTGVGSNNLYSSSQLTGTSRTLSGLPSGTIYVRLSSRCGASNAWSAIDYSYTGPSVNCTGAQMTSPTNGSTIAATTTFTWNTGTGNTEYWLQVGTTGVGSNNLYSASQLTGTSRTLSGLPSGTIYVRLSSRCGANNAWSAVDYSYTGPSANCTGAQMTSPTNGSTIAATTTFTWNTGTGNTEYWLQVGTTGVGSNNLYSSSQLTGTSRTLSGLPSGTIYVRLSSRCGGNNTWSAIDYSYIR